MEWLAGVISGMWSIILDALKESFFWGIKYIADLFAMILEGVFEALSDVPGVGDSIFLLQPWVNAVNAWAPLDLFFLLAASYLALWPSVYILRVGIKVIRG